MNISAEYQALDQLSAESLVQRYADLVRRVARHLAARLPSDVDVDDLIQAGMLCLFEAVSKYRGERGASCETYATIRVRGAMLDELRRMDWAPRSVHRRIREMVKAIQVVEARLGRHAAESEVASEMGLSLQAYREIACEAVTCRMFSSDELALDDPLALLGADHDDPETSLNRAALQQALVEAITALPPREALMMNLYYVEELNLREIGEVMGVSESRVCQLHGQALARLRANLKEWRA